MKKAFLISAIAISLFACAILAADPSYADIIYDENNLFENLTTIICSVALLFAFAILFRRFFRE